MKNFKFTILKNQLALFLGVWCLMVGVSANAQTYTRSTSAGTTLVPITSPTNQNLTDDQFVTGIDMGFNFPFYGGNYNSVSINANGFLRFSPNAGTGSFTNQNLSTNCGTNFTNLLAPLWDDWNSDAGTNVQWGPTAAGGFAVTFVRQGFSYLGGASGNYATFQVVLSPNGTINYIYNDIDIGSGTGNFGGTATVGINGNNSGECDQFSFNASIAGTGTLTYTPSTLIQALTAAPVSTCSSNGTTYNQPVSVSFNSAPVAGTVFQICYQSGCAQNQPTNSNLAAAPYVCQTFMASGSTTQSVTLANVACDAMTFRLYGLYGPTGGSQPLYIGCVGTQGATFTTPQGLPCELVCPSNQTLFAGSLEDCVVAFYDLKTFGNCAQPFSFGPVTALNTAISQNLVSVTLATTGASGQSATRNGNVITLTSGTGTSTATASLRFTYGGTFSAAWSYVNNTDPFFDPFTWQLIRGGTVVQSFSTASACSNLTCSGSITNLAVQPNDILLFTQSGDFIFGPVSTTITFQSMTASGSTTLTPVVAAGSLAPGSCFPIGNNSVTINLINPISGAVVNSCTFNINVVPNPATGVLVCNDHVNISLSDGCTAVIRPDDVLEGSQYGPSSRYEVAVSKNPNGPWLVVPSVNQNNCGDWYYRVRDKVTNNTCWGTLTVEDKIAPSLACGACPGNLAGIIELSDINGQFVGFGASPIPAPGATCGANFFTRTDYVQFTLPSTGSGNYKFTLTSSVIVTTANLGSQLGLALYNGQPNPNNSCQNNIRIDGQSLNGVPETINGHFNNVALTPGATYWIGVQQPRHALGAAGAVFPHDWAVNVIDLATGQNALTSPENCAVDCVDKPALLDFIAKGQINNLVALGIPTPVATGGYCGGTPQYTVKLKNDNSTSCGGFIVIEWGVTEACGAKAFVDCRIKVNPMKFEDVELPAGIGDPLYIHCKDGTTPEEIAAEWGVENAFPYFVDAAGNKQPISGVCNFYASYADISLDACAPHCHGNKKVIRKWTLLDWCTGSLAEATQIIKAVDQEAPTFTVKDTVVSTRPWDCTAEFYLPRPWELHDNCDANPRYEVIAPEGVWVNWDAARGLWRASGAPLGVTTFTYKAYDCCGNIGVETIDVRVTDRTAPVAVAKQNIVISLVPGGSDGAGQAKMFVESVDNGSFDNCTGVRMEIRRMDNANCANINVGNNGHNNNSTFSNSPIPGFTNSANDTDGGQFVKFCCADIDAAQGFGIVKVELRVWDDANGNGNPGDVVQGVADNYNVTWVDVRVETKIPPVITCPPAMTIFCDWAIDQNVGNGDASAKSIAGFDFSKTGLPSAYGVCGAADIRFWDREVLDQCDLGYIDRTFLVTNNGQTVKCVQRITVQQSPAQAPWVFIPSSLSENPIATSCDGPSQADIERNAPKYTAGPCDVIGVSTKVHQFDFEGGVCRKWKVEYKYVNWCTNEERGPFVKNFAYEDKVAPVMTCADQMFEVDGNCERVVELKKSATDAGGCVEGGWLKWEVYVDLWADGSQDLLYSSFYAGPQGAVKTININGVAHVVRQYTLAPTTSGGEAKFTLPEPIEGKVSNHKVVWKVTDGCHNWESCHEEFMVADKKAPTPVCVPLTTALMQDPDGSGPLKPMVELWAIDFMNKSYDNCTDESDLLYTFEGWAPQVTLKLDGAGNPMSIDHPHFFNANGGVASAVNPNTSVYKAALTQYQLGNLQLWIPSNRSSAKVWVSDTYNSGSKKEVDVKVTVWDKRFNSDYCWTTLGLLHGGDGAAPRIAGNVSTAAGQAVNNVMINVAADITEYPKSVATGSNGNYTMEVVAGNTYEITANKSGDFLNGVSTLDLVMIQRHILGLQKLDNPYKLIAADVNNDGKVTASDLTELRKLILGITPEFAKNSSWRFPVKSQTLDANNPFPFVEKIGQEVLGTDVNNLDFVAVKIGDVNGNVATNVADPMTESRSNKAVVMSVAEQAVAAGDVVSVPVTAANFNEVMGYQFTMKLNGARFAGIEAGAINVDASNVGVLENGVITMSFASNEAVSANEGTVLFTLVLNADKAGNVSEMIAVTSDVTAAESYNADLEVGKVSLDVRTAPVASIELFQNEPNPFRGQTTVTFNMPVAAKATLSIYDVTGKVVTVRNIDAVKGMNSEIFTREQVGATGVLYYTLESGDFTATKKMIIIE